MTPSRPEPVVWRSLVVLGVVFVGTWSLGLSTGLAGPGPLVALQTAALLVLVAALGWWWVAPLVRDLQRLVDDLRTLGRENPRLRAREPSGALRPFAVEVNRLAARVEHVLDAQEQMLEAVSHELRTPVARLQFRVEALRDGERVEQQLDAMEDDLSELDALLSELVTYLRVDVMDATCSDVEVGILVERLLARQRPLHPHVDGQVVGDVTWSVPRKGDGRGGRGDGRRRRAWCGARGPGADLRAVRDRQPVAGGGLRDRPRAADRASDRPEAGGVGARRRQPSGGCALRVRATLALGTPEGELKPG
jgi:signal transduction histidine kinase